MIECDVAIIGGGPAGSTAGALLRQYDPTLRVLIFEREWFPRDHVGESQLPVIGQVLHEMGVWEKVEAAGFPIKVGATYRWGTSDDLWNFDFIPNGQLHDELRPGRFAGQRSETAFQVDRAIYDKILLDHAQELGCTVREGTRVVRVSADGDRVEGLETDDGETTKARYYVDATGGSGLVRRTFGIEVEQPTSLQNIAIWDYWQNAEWAAEIGVGGTRVQVLSLGYGWIWFIPLGPTRTSVGLVVPAAYYKRSRLRTEELYQKAISEEPRIRSLLANATSEGKLLATKDWSFVATRMSGENWWLAGDACGFADPILAAGMTLAHASAREVAYCLLEAIREPEGLSRLREVYNDRHSRRLRQHIRFADYWYSANAHFTDLKEYTREIARAAGLDLDPDRAFQWLGTGGFVNDDLGYASIGAYSIGAIKQIAQVFGGAPADWRINRANEFRLNLVGAHSTTVASFREGRVRYEPAYVRDGKVLALVGPYRHLFNTLQHENSLSRIVGRLEATLPRGLGDPKERVAYCLHALETMVVDGWVKGRLNKKHPSLALRTDDETPTLYRNREPLPVESA
jgi:flavin-dependent dehydrogenase